MGWGDAPPPAKPDKPAAEVQTAQRSEDLFNEIFAVKSNNNQDKRAQVENLGRIESLTLPQGWVKGNESPQQMGYAREFHPEGNENTQMVFSYRGHRLSDNASSAFRRLIDSVGPEAKAVNAVDARSVQQPPLNEVLGDEGHRNTFQVVSAKVQRINGEPALVVEGKYTNHDVNARFIYFDADRNARGNGNAPVQEIAIIAPTKEFFKAAMTASQQLDQIKWKR